MLLWAAIGDLRERRLRNWFTVTLMLSGLAQSLTPFHTVTFGASCLGWLAGFGLMFILFALGAVGGGDVKFMAGVGAWLGPAGVMGVFILQSLIGLVLVLAQALWQGRLAALFHNACLMLINIAHVKELGVEHVAATGKTIRTLDRPLPYAVPVFLAVAAMAIQSYITH